MARRRGFPLTLLAVPLAVNIDQNARLIIAARTYHERLRSRTLKHRAHIINDPLVGMHVFD